MRRPLVLLCVAALSTTGLALSAPASAAPSASAATTAHAAVADELVVGYVAGATSSDRARARGRAEARFAERVVAAQADRAEVERVVLPAGRDRGQAIAALQGDPAVAYAEPNWLYTRTGKPGGGGSTPLTPTFGTAPAGVVSDSAYLSGELWGMLGSGTSPKNDFGANPGPAWAKGRTGSTEVVVGVIDEGIQVNHPELAGVVVNAGETAGNGVDDDGNGYVDDVHGWDFVSEDSSVFDGSAGSNVDAHGTHVSGTIGALPNGGRIVGVNQAVSLVSGKFLGPSSGSLADAVQAVDYFSGLKDRGRNVVATSNSWGGGGFSQALLDAIRRAAARDILFVAAAGNSGSNNDRRASYPSNYSAALPGGGDAVIAVAAIDKAGALASFSQYGASTVDLGAPGVGVLSSVPVDGYATYNGTSMATPHVSGAVALYEAAHPGATGTQIRSAILGSAVPTGSLSGRTVTGGRLDTAGALER